jgi:predicted alpha/beta superfamily hydrolase
LQVLTQVITTPAGDYRLWLSIPEGEAPARGYPSAWVLDGASLFALVSPIARRLAGRPQATGVPPMVIIGLDHEPADIARRYRDYTACAPQTEDGGQHDWGGAEALLDMLTGDALRAVETLVPLDPKARTLVGHSLSGLFTLRAMATRPDAFAVFAAVSPSVWWNPDDIDAALRAMPDRGQRLFIAAGEREQARGDASAADARRASRHMLAGSETASRLAAERLGADAVRLTIAPDEDHASAIVAVLPALLRFAAQLLPTR